MTPTAVLPRDSTPLGNGAIIGISISVFFAVVALLAGYKFLAYLRKTQLGTSAAIGSESPAVSYGQPTPPPVPELPPAELLGTCILDANRGPQAEYFEPPSIPQSELATTTLQPMETQPPALPASRSSKRSTRSRRHSNASSSREVKSPQAGQPYYAQPAQRDFPQFQG